MIIFIRHVMTACILTLVSLMIQPSTGEHAMYGNMGPPEQNWQPRELAGWPAAFIADSPHTSVVHKIGIEDDFRLGPFLATLSFWYLVSILLNHAASVFRRIFHNAGLGRRNSKASVDDRRAEMN